jgi:holo-[acyl-carrier protein] synthase
MILGIGTDICALERIQKMLEGSKRELFLKKTYTPLEISAAPGAKAEVAYFAGRWAAKEAVAKALGTGFGAQCSWLGIEILRKPSGAPEIILSGSASLSSDNLGVTDWHLTISHERSHAVAFAIAEKNA